MEQMTVVDIPIGQLVFIIENNEIYEATITRFFNQKEVLVTAKQKDYPYYPTTKRTYGVDFFFTRPKAETFLVMQIESRKKREMEERERQRKIQLEQLRIREEERGLAVQASRQSICNACGLPIGAFGHCGCSY
jgi:hypothetical protein